MTVTVALFREHLCLWHISCYNYAYRNRWLLFEHLKLANSSRLRAYTGFLLFRRRVFIGTSSNIVILGITWPDLLTCQILPGAVELKWLDYPEFAKLALFGLRVGVFIWSSPNKVKMILGISSQPILVTSQIPSGILELWPLNNPNWLN